MPQFTGFYGNPENFRGRKRHYHLDVSISPHADWLHYYFHGDHHLHVKSDEEDFSVDSVMLIGERISIVADNNSLNFKTMEFDFRSSAIHWRAGVLDNNQRVLNWSRDDGPGLIFKI